MPAPRIYSSGLQSGANALYRMVADRAAAQLAAEQLAETRRMQRNKEALEWQSAQREIARILLEGRRVDLEGERVGITRADSARAKARADWEMANPERSTRTVMGQDGRPRLEEYNTRGGGNRIDIGAAYEKPEYLTMQEQRRADGTVVDRVIDPRAPKGSPPIYESPVYVRPVTGGSGGGTGGMDDADIEALAQMAIDNPDALDKMQIGPRTRAMALIQSGGEGGKFLLGRQRMLDQVLRETEDSITALQKHPGVASAVGRPSLMDPNSWTRVAGLEPIPGSDAAGAAQEIKHLMALLTTPRLELMRGLGAMSEREFDAMRATASKLGTNLKDSEFYDELYRLLQTTRSARARLAAGSARPGVRPGATGTPEAAAAPPAGGLAGMSREQRRAVLGY